MSIYVGNLAYQVTIEDISEILTEEGDNNPFFLHSKLLTSSLIPIEETK
ncbi:MAG: hypothetical protein F6J86_37125 [Symploca sp. SIO1B1]|nr:hypothetical protein [Symploca sp. SIO1C2]NER99381.1 hypothetical protein [Symploca sp. SIO1B1]